MEADISLMFDDLKRSTAKTCDVEKNGILSQESFDELSEETKDHIELIINANQ
jgi:hypothetical protein